MNIYDIPLMAELIRTADSIHRRGWAERYGGNLSLILDDFPITTSLRDFLLPSIPPELFHKYIVISGSGKYLRNISRAAEENLAVLHLRPGHAELVWGLSGGGSPSSELSAHLCSHAARLSVDSSHTTVIHAHTPNLIAMTMVHPLDEREFTRSLWKIASECIMFFPDGISILPWMPCGTDDIGVATANKMRSSRITLWTHHGIFAAGSSPDDALGLIEIAEKASDIFMKTAHLPVLSRISDEQLVSMATLLSLKVRRGYLESVSLTDSNPISP